MVRRKLVLDEMVNIKEIYTSNVANLSIEDIHKIQTGVFRFIITETGSLSWEDFCYILTNDITKQQSPIPCVSSIFVYYSDYFEFAMQFSEKTRMECSQKDMVKHFMQYYQDKGPDYKSAALDYVNIIKNVREYFFLNSLILNNCFSCI